MSTLKSPALDPASIPPRTGSIYPKPHDEVVRGRTKFALTPALKLTQFGVNVTVLEPGAQSALRHWHSHEDEFVWVLEGEIALVTNEGKQLLRAGHCAAFPAGVANGHHLINESAAPARYLEVGSRHNDDECDYTEVDLHVGPGRYTSKAVFTKRDGSPLD